MTIRMKKLLTILLMLTCVLGLTACGQEAKPKFHYDEMSMLQVAGNSLEIINGVSALVSVEQIDEQFGTLNDDELELLADKVYNYGYEESGVPSGPKTTGKAFVNGMRSYRSSLDEIGEITSVDIANYEMVQKDKELIVTIPLKGSIHNGSFEVIFDKNLHATSFTTNVEYSLAESMQKAAMNTAIGMGTVFVMLIVIMIIIYGFAIIPKIQASAEAKKQAKTTTEESVDNAIQGIVEREDVATDDLELIAVIAAAIAASEGASSTDGFVVRSIRRIK